MAYVSKRVYGILMAKAKKDVKVRALLNMLSDMDQQEANTQVRMVLYNKTGGSPMTGDYEKPKKESARQDRASLVANKAVDSGKYDNYDDAYNSISRQLNRYGPAYILKQEGLPLEYNSENILLEMFKEIGIEIKRIGKDTLIVIIDGEENELPFVREGDKIEFIKK